MKRYFLFVVEGPHDAAFTGLILKERGFSKATRLADVDPYWLDLIPKVFPTGPKLEHVVRYPDIYANAGGDSCAIVVAGGDSRLLSELRVSLEILDGSTLAGLCIIADADEQVATHRLGQLQAGLVALNSSHGPGGPEGGAQGIPGFPLTIPTSAGEVAGSNTRVGLYIFPDNNSAGTLDALLLECAETSLIEVCEPTRALVASIDGVVPAGDVRFKLLRKPAGREKAAAGVISNLLFPGSALSSAIEKGSWLEGLSGNEVGLNAFRQFCASFLA